MPSGPPVTTLPQRLLTVILVLAIAILAGAGAALFQHTRTAEYASSATLLIDQPIAIAAASDDGTLAKLQSLRYQYAGLLNTDVIGNPVGRQLHLAPSAVEAALIGLVEPTTFNLVVQARTPSPQRSSLIAQAASSQLVSYVASTQKKAGVAAGAQVELTEVLQPAKGVQVAPTNDRQIVSGVVVFVAVILACIIVGDLMRRRR